MDAYIFRADIYCADCALAQKHELADARTWRALENTRDSDDWPQGPYADGGGEADTPQHCGSCGTFLDNPLTADGLDYVTVALSEGNAPQEWYDAYLSIIAERAKGHWERVQAWRRA